MNWASKWWVIGSLGFSVILTIISIWVNANRVLITVALAVIWFFTGGVYSNYKTLRLLDDLRRNFQ